MALKEEIDFYMEDGKFIFTLNYLRNRGFCCGNKCRYCPYTESVKGNTELKEEFKIKSQGLYAQLSSSNRITYTNLSYEEFKKLMDEFYENRGNQQNSTDIPF